MVSSEHRRAERLSPSREIDGDDDRWDESD
ncbi:MAG: hypothetical protein JWQ77_1163, partial [Jatrophihabitans sp.]|nr:hypothetical protein [Jatrophihabitans sp.]